MSLSPHDAQRAIGNEEAFTRNMSQTPAEVLAGAALDLGRQMLSLSDRTLSLREARIVVDQCIAVQAEIIHPFDRQTVLATISREKLVHQLVES